MMNALSIVIGIAIIVWNIYAAISNAKNGFPIMALIGLGLVIWGIYKLIA